MCGIAGILRLDDQEVSPQRLEAMIAQVHHRGPDAAEWFVNRNVGLAHSRLSIIDLGNGRQPMQTSDGRLTVTFNGEIFNYVELRRTLIEQGHQFRTQSDTEVILHAYEEYGEHCVEHFNGQWAFAIWDKQRNSLFLSRDRMGIRPLFYTQTGRQFLFASEIKSLFTHPEINRALNPQGVSQLFTFWTPLAPTTVFQDIQELPPGHHLLVKDGKVRSYPYWQLEFPSDGSTEFSDDWPEALRERLIGSIRLRLRSDVPVGA